MPNTTNYGWATPADTDLVKDGAAAIRTLGTAIDTTTYSNAQAAIAKTIVDAKGDLIVATAADTVSRLAVGTNGYTLVADSSEATGLKWAAPSGGGMTLLSTTTLSGSSTTISAISGSYNNLQLVIFGANCTVTAGVLVLRPNAVTNLCSGAGVDNNNGTAINVIINNSGIELGFASGMPSGNTDNIYSIIFYNYASSTNFKSFIAQYGFPRNTSGNLTGGYNGVFRSNTAISSIEIVASGSFSAGTALLYGVK
jgi:hypothetical protein